MGNAKNPSQLLVKEYGFVYIGCNICLHWMCRSYTLCDLSFGALVCYFLIGFNPTEALFAGGWIFALPSAPTRT
jgi:hypothetical protein